MEFAHCKCSIIIITIIIITVWLICWLCDCQTVDYLFVWMTAWLSISVTVSMSVRLSDLLSDLMSVLLSVCHSLCLTLFYIKSCSWSRAFHISNQFIPIIVLFSELLKPNGRFIKKGDPIKRTKYGKTLQKIAEAGADEFYSGKMAKQVHLLLVMYIEFIEMPQLIEMPQCTLCCPIEHCFGTMLWIWCEHWQLLYSIFSHVAAAMQIY